MKENTKNYILYILGCVITLFIVFMALKISDKRKNELSSISYVNSYLSEIRYKEIPTHLIENPNQIIYVSNSSLSSSQKFERKFVPIIKKYNLENQIIYININEENIIDPYYQNAPQLIFHNNGSVNDIISCDTLKTKKDIIKIFKERSVIGD